MHNRLKKARRVAGFTQEQVAKKFGITRTAVSLWESDGEQGTKPDIRKLQELAALYKTSVEELLGSDTSPGEETALSGSSEPAQLTREEKQVISLMKGIRKEARDTWIKMGGHLSEQAPERRKEDTKREPERRRHFGIIDAKRSPKDGSTKKRESDDDGR